MKKCFSFFLFLFLIMLFCVSNVCVTSVVLADTTDEEQAMKNYDDFEDEIIVLTKQISQATKYAYQDTEFVENAMDGDETVYARAWKGNGYFLIRCYEDNSWSENESWLANFILHENSSFNLKGKIKIGSSVNELKNFFGDFIQIEANQDSCYVSFDSYTFYFEIDNQRQCVKTISCSYRGNITSKMGLLEALYDNNFMIVKVKGEKVNVRSEASINGRVLFQVSRSKGDKLIVRKNDYNGWYAVDFRFTNNNNAEVINTEAYIKGDFIEREKTNFTQDEKDRLASIFMNSREAQLAYIDTESQAPIEDVRERMYYQNYPQDLDYLPFGKQLEKFFAKGQWSEESVPKLEESFSKLAVFKGIGTWNGRRTWVTVKIGRAKKKINNIKEGSLVVISIMENKNLLYSFDRVMPSGVTGAYFNLLTAELEAFSGNSVRNKISLSDFIDTIYKESEIEQLFKSF